MNKLIDFNDHLLPPAATVQASPIGPHRFTLTSHLSPTPSLSTLTLPLTLTLKLTLPLTLPLA